MTLHGVAGDPRGRWPLLARIPAVALSVVLLGSLPPQAQPVPPGLSALATKAQLTGPIAAWCRGEFRSGHAEAYAVAVGPTATGGRYLVLERDVPVVELAPFTSGADLSCYSPAEARRLNRSIQQSETIEGKIVPRWPTTVVCGFLDDTTSVCWQYSPDARAFVKVGGWVT